MELIRIENLFKTYFLGEVDVPVLKGVSLTIEKGEMVALMGVSGSGKSTLMNILGLLDRPTSGNYWLNGQEVSRLSADRRATVRNRNIGFVFQSFNLLARSSAIEQVRMPLVYAAKPWSNRDERRRAVSLLEKVGLGQRLDHEPSQLSGGQQQRVAISRALVNHPPILLADEPTGNLDSRTSEEILQMFQRLNQEEGISVILVTHDLNVARHANRIIYIRDGLIDNDALAQLMDSDRSARNGRHSSNGHASANGHAPSNRHFGAQAIAGSVESESDQGGDDFDIALADHAATAVASPAAARTVSSGTVVAEPFATAAVPVVRQHKPVTRRAAVRLMPRTLTTALHAIHRNKFRSLLTTLGIVMGIGAVIAMMEIGQGSATAIQRTISTMGANRLIVMPGSVENGGVHQGSGSVVTLTPADCDAIMRECPAVLGVAPFVRARTQVVNGNKNWVPGFIGGTTPQYLQIRSWTEMSEGSGFSDRDVADATAVCVLGQTVATNLFGDDSPVGKDVRIQGVAFRVLGVLSPKGANMFGNDQDDLLLAPWTTIKYRVSSIGAQVANQSAMSAASSGNNDASTTISNTASAAYPNMGPNPNLYPSVAVCETADTPQPVRFVNVDQIMVQANSSADIPIAIDQISDLLHDRHHIAADASDDFLVRDLTEMTNAMSKQSKVMGALLLAVAMISLMVGGVGIMNIMLVSVTERTREIGLRMAVGARPKDILRQFISEAVILCLLGGAVGILAGRGGSLLVRELLNWPTEISLPAILAAVVVSVTVGLAFGYYPAWKASRLDPIEALRYE